MANETVKKTNPEIKPQVTEMNDRPEFEEVSHDAEAIMENAEDLYETEEERRLLIARNKVAARTAIKRANQPGLADGMVGPGTANMSPGAMQMSAVAKFHSTQSINLFRGRKGDPVNGVRPIIGLARFARQVSLVWSAAAIDDPYADQVLLNIEEAYEAAKVALDSKEKSMTDLLEGMEDFDVTMQASIHPVEIKLQFYSPWGFRGAMLLKQFDKLVRMALTARHIGIFTESDWVSIVRDSARALRHMFNEVDAWVSTGVKREDIRKNTKVAVRAAARYAELKKGGLMVDQEVINGLYRAKLSPVNRILEKYLTDVSQVRAAPKEKMSEAEAVAVNTKTNDAGEKSSKASPNFGFSAVNRSGVTVSASSHVEPNSKSSDEIKEMKEPKAAKLKIKMTGEEQ